MVTGITLPEVAEKYCRPVKTVDHWRAAYPWPRPAGKRGHADEYDPAEVELAVARILCLPERLGGDPGELVGMEEAAAEAGLEYASARSRKSRGRWPDPDAYRGGSERWRRETVRAWMLKNKPVPRHGGKLSLFTLL